MAAPMPCKPQVARELCRRCRSRSRAMKMIRSSATVSATTDTISTVTQRERGEARKEGRFDTALWRRTLRAAASHSCSRRREEAGILKSPEESAQRPISPRLRSLVRCGAERPHREGAFVSLENPETTGEASIYSRNRERAFTDSGSISTSRSRQTRAGRVPFAGCERNPLHDRTPLPTFPLAKTRA